jgi:UDP-N-acetylglucosamine:LPS N-acetylglucosamine transferase
MSTSATTERALFLSGSFGMGHDTLAEACAGALGRHGVETEMLDSMKLLGNGPGALGDWIFRRLLLGITPVYDAFHFSQLRGDGPLGRFVDKTGVKTMLRLLREEAAKFDPQLVVSVFATGAGAAVHLKADQPDLITVVFLTDSFAHRMWVHEGTDLFLVTSAMAAASVRRYWPQAPVEVVNAPVRPGFYAAPSKAEARRQVGVPEDAGCALLMSGAWGMGPLDEVADALAGAGYWVLAVGGINEKLSRRLEAVASVRPEVIPFGFTDRIPELMAASDVIVTSSGDTCREARVIGRPLVLLDVVPGHGRENLMHELELGNAAVCSPEPDSVLGTVRQFLADHPPAEDASNEDTRVSAASWDDEFLVALSKAGVVLPVS